MTFYGFVWVVSVGGEPGCESWFATTVSGKPQGTSYYPFHVLPHLHLPSPQICHNQPCEAYIATAARPRHYLLSVVLCAVIPQLNVVTRIAQKLCSKLAKITHLGMWSARSHRACRLGALWMLCVDSSYAPYSLPILPEITGTLNSKYGILTRTPPVLCKCTWASATRLLLSLSLSLSLLVEKRQSLGSVSVVWLTKYT